MILQKWKFFVISINPIKRDIWYSETRHNGSNIFSANVRGAALINLYDDFLNVVELEIKRRIYDCLGERMPVRRWKINA